MQGPTRLCTDVFLLDRSQLPWYGASVVTQPRMGPSPSFTGILPFCPQRHHQLHPELISTSQTGFHIATAPCCTSTCLGPTAGTCRLGAQWSLYIAAPCPFPPAQACYHASSSPPPPCWCEPCSQGTMMSLHMINTAAVHNLIGNSTTTGVKTPPEGQENLRY